MRSPSTPTIVCIILIPVVPLSQFALFWCQLLRFKDNTSKKRLISLQYNLTRWHIACGTKIYYEKQHLTLGVMVRLHRLIHTP